MAKGLYKIETLLESSVDDYFDKFEAYAIRNCFAMSVNPDLLPYIRLPHHPVEGYLPGGASAGAASPRRKNDAALLKEWADEREKLDEAEESYKDVRAAALRINRRLHALKRVKDELAGDLPKAEDAKQAIEALKSLQTSASKLADMPAPPPLPSAVEQPWDRREAFIAFAADRKIAQLDLKAKARPAGEPVGTEDDARVRRSVRWSDERRRSASWCPASRLLRPDVDRLVLYIVPGLQREYSRYKPASSPRVGHGRLSSCSSDRRLGLV